MTTGTELDTGYRAFVRSVKTLVKYQPGITRVDLIAKIPVIPPIWDDVTMIGKFLDNMVIKGELAEIGFQVSSSSPVESLYFPGTYLIHVPVHSG